MISTRSNSLFNKAQKAGGKKDGLTGRKLSYYLGNKLGMGNIKGGTQSLDKFVEPLKRY